MMHTTHPANYFNLRDLFHSNPYEIFSIKEETWGRIGRFFNSYIKMVMFIGSMISKRNPYDDMPIYLLNCLNNLYQAILPLEEPVIIFDNLDFMVHATKSKSVAFAGYSDYLQSVICYVSLAMNVDAQVATIILIVEDPEALVHGPLHKLKKHSIVRNVERQKSTPSSSHEEYVLGTRHETLRYRTLEWMSDIFLISAAISYFLG